jgi:voltage-gated potassium channel
MDAMIRRRLVLIGALIAGSLAIGTAGFIIIDGYPAFDAFYMAVITITTVGYLEVHPLSQAGRLFNSFLLLFGVSTLFLAVGVVTQTVFELEFNHYFVKRRTRRMIEKLNHHYIICGLGRIGRGAADELHRSNVPFIILERDEHKVERAMRGGMLAALGDATLDVNLREVGIDRAKGMICALGTDADNLFLVISAKALNPKLQISARVMEEEAERKLLRAGADTVLAPYHITGSRLAQAILRPHVFQFLDFASIGLDVGIEQVRVDDKTSFVSKTLGQMQLRREVGVIVLGIRKATGQMIFNPHADSVVAAGDVLIAMGGLEQLRKLERIVGGSEA